MTEPERVDFTKVIAEIEAAGIKPNTICKMLHRHHTQLRRWKAGSEPRHYEGQMLLMIHREYAVQLHPTQPHKVENQA